MDVQAIHLRVIEVLAVRRGDREQVAVAFLAALRVTRGIQLLAHGFQQEREVLLVLGPVLDAGNALPRVFPVEVDARPRDARRIRLDRALSERFPRGISQRGVGEAVRLPAADRDEHFQPRILLLQRDAGTSATGANCRILEDDLAVAVDPREREVDVRQLFRGNDRRR